MFMFIGTYQVYGALRMTVKMFLMWNSELHIDGGGGDTTVSTSMLEASNLFVLRVLTNSCHSFSPKSNLRHSVASMFFCVTSLSKYRDHLSFGQMQILESMDKVS